MESHKGTVMERILGAVRPFSKESPCLGLAFGRESLWAVFSQERDGKPAAEWSRKFPLPGGPFSPKSGPEGARVLGEALDVIRREAGKGYLEVQVALPDPAVRIEVMELETVPAPGKPLEEFLDWRFSQGRKGAAAGLEFTTQALGEEDGKVLFLAEAVDRAALEAVRGALEARGLEASVIDSAVGLRFDRHYDVLRKGGKGGAMLSVEPDHWSLLIWDARTRPRFAASRWWKKDAVKAAGLPLEAALLECERLVRSYVYSGKGRDVEAFHVCAPEGWGEAVLKTVKRRIEGRCSALEGGLDSLKGTALRDLPAAVLAAAVARR